MYIVCLGGGGAIGVEGWGGGRLKAHGFTKVVAGEEEGGGVRVQRTMRQGQA